MSTIKSLMFSGKFLRNQLTVDECTKVMKTSLILSLKVMQFDYWIFVGTLYSAIMQLHGEQYMPLQLIGSTWKSSFADCKFDGCMSYKWWRVVVWVFDKIYLIGNFWLLAITAETLRLTWFDSLRLTTSWLSNMIAMSWYLRNRLAVCTTQKI